MGGGSSCGGGGGELRELWFIDFIMYMYSRGLALDEMHPVQWEILFFVYQASLVLRIPLAHDYCMTFELALTRVNASSKVMQ